MLVQVSSLTVLCVLLTTQHVHSMIHVEFVEGNKDALRKEFPSNLPTNSDGVLPSFTDDNKWRVYGVETAVLPYLLVNEGLVGTFKDQITGPNPVGLFTYDPKEMAEDYEILQIKGTPFYKEMHKAPVFTWYDNRYASGGYFKTQRAYYFAPSDTHSKIGQPNIFVKENGRATWLGYVTGTGISLIPLIKKLC